MTSIVKGLAAIRANQEEQKAKQEAANRPKAEWFKWPAGVTVAIVRFLQELDADADGYKEDRGVGFIAVEHQAPGADGYKRRGLCTADSEGACYACERHSQDYREGWRQRQNLYINALVDFGSGEKKVVVITRNANATFTHSLIEEAVEDGSITNSNFKITKVGEGTGTQWLLKRLKGDPFDDSGVEVFDLDETAVRAIPYEKQADYYGSVYKETAPGSGETASSDSAPVDEEW